jgi:hypothetical protein
VKQFSQKRISFCRILFSMENIWGWSTFPRGEYLSVEHTSVGRTSRLEYSSRGRIFGGEALFRRRIFQGGAFFPEENNFG